jgi:cytochrome P450
MDPISNALSRILNVLASHQEVQENLRQEILEAFSKNGQEELSHDELIALPLLDAVCRETLRLSVR